MSIVQAIGRKRDGLPLERSEITSFVRGAAARDLPVEQLAAMLMAICCRGMSRRETLWLTEEMLLSGEVWELGKACPAAVDKHSTGGVGDTVSLILAPILAAAGVPVAMMAGRGLGHTQGTIDKLEAIPGFRCERSKDEMLALIDECGAAIIAQTPEVAPADRTLYALRDQTATIPSLPLITGSIMSKKLALGASTLILDVKWGRGAFLKTVEAASELAKMMREVAEDSGVACQALITDMNQPLGRQLGLASEVEATLAILEGSGSKRLRDLTLRLAKELMLLRGYEADEADQRLEEALASGRARAQWDLIVRAHGGDPDPALLAQPSELLEVSAGDEGYVCGIDGEGLGWQAAMLGAGRRTLDDELAFGAGIDCCVRLGHRVERGQPLAIIRRGERSFDAEEAMATIRRCFEIGDEPPTIGPLVL